MDRRLSAEDLQWLKAIRSLEEAKPAATRPPLTIMQKLLLLGLATATPEGDCRITFKGRDELIDREREEMRWH